jgi:hypothetical protein
MVKREDLEAIINEFETNNETKNIRLLYWGINDYKTG